MKARVLIIPILLLIPFFNNNKENITFNTIDINLSKMIENSNQFSTNIFNDTDLFEDNDYETLKIFDECNSKLINL